MDRGAAMLAVVLEVYEGGKDLIPGWTLKDHAKARSQQVASKGSGGSTRRPWLVRTSE
jgi:hypothetical protein